eukprot:Phypoly_transcript_00710.p2 GENE.Phypoly_transcript_00710~~Phypoly_transcript_00710.p2  ORF type:complete len:629 (+),score=72.18 Phypoly_transcript_00710:62-1948(+)
MKVLATLCIISCFASLATCKSYYLNTTYAFTTCASNCSLLDQSIWVNNSVPDCTGNDDVYVLSSASSPVALQFELVLNESCALSSIYSNVSNVIFVVSENGELNVGSLTYQSQLLVQYGGIVSVSYSTIINNTGQLLSVENGGSFTHTGESSFMSSSGVLVNISGNFTINSWATSIILGDILVQQNATFQSSNLILSNKATFYTTPVFTRGLMLSGAECKFLRGVTSDSSSISATVFSSIIFSNNANVSSLTVDETSNATFLESNASVFSGSLYGNVIINSSQLYIKQNAIIAPLKSASLIFSGSSIFTTEFDNTPLVLNNVTAADDHTNVTIYGKYITAMNGNHQNMTFCSIFCYNMRLDSMSLRSFTVENLSIVRSLTTIEGLTITGQYSSASNGNISINSAVHLGPNSTAPFQNTTITGDVYVTQANLILQNSTIYGNVITSGASSSIYGSSIYGDIHLDGNSSALVQSSTAFGNVNTNGTLAIDKTFNISGNFTQLEGTLIFSDVNFNASKNSANNLQISGHAFFSGALNANITGFKSNNLTKQIYLINFTHRSGQFNHKIFKSLDNSTDLEVIYTTNNVSVKVHFDMVSVWFGVVAVGTGVIGAIIFIYFTSAPWHSIELVNS